jgi:glycosyltransferase involved in cell wall biosynthesis
LDFLGLRLFAWNDELWCCGSVRELTPEGWCEQVLARVEDRRGTCQLTDWRVLRADGRRQHEENWLPHIAGHQLRFISLCDPTRVLDEQARTVAETTPAIAAENFRGGSQAIAFDGGALALVHEVEVRDEKRCYYHRFVWFDPARVLRRVSRRFFFEHKGVEFAAGLAWHPYEQRLLISYGVDDRSSWIATVDAGEVRDLLDDVNAPPCGEPHSCRVWRPPAAPEKTWRSDGSERVAPVTSEKTETRFLSTDLAQLVRPFRVSDGVPAVAQSSTEREESEWIPEAPAAGTELMLTGLKARLGQELDRINLQSNHPGYDKDNRPLVVWVQHDVDQVWMKWCNDRSLVELVDCFVFVSYWQRERYRATFGLPPERCIVLYNATEVGPDLRRWEPGPVWRCAYTSTPFRGLSLLLDAWQRLSLANAELHVWSSMKLYLCDDGPYNHLYERARSMPGVFYHGIVPNPELRAALQNMDFLVYPSTFAETSCLAVIEAMAAGCRVIVPSLGALPETTCGYARVYPWNPDAHLHTRTFSDILADEIANPWIGEPDLSLAQQRHCPAVYDWRHRLSQWRRLIGHLTASNRGLRV